jgi:hypothetical protein
MKTLSLLQGDHLVARERSHFPARRLGENWLLSMEVGTTWAYFQTMREKISLWMEFILKLMLKHF